MKLIGILDTEANRTVAYGNEHALSSFLDERLRAGTFHDVLTNILGNYRGEKWLANEIQNYLQQCNETTIFLAIDCYNAAGEITRKNARLHEPAADYFDIREVGGSVYECLEMAIKLVSAVG